MYVDMLVYFQNKPSGMDVCVCAYSCDREKEWTNKNIYTNTDMCMNGWTNINEKKTEVICFMSLCLSRFADTHWKSTLCVRMPKTTRIFVIGVVVVFVAGFGVVSVWFGSVHTCGTGTERLGERRECDIESNKSVADLGVCVCCVTSEEYTRFLSFKKYGIEAAWQQQS